MTMYNVNGHCRHDGQSVCKSHDRATKQGYVNAVTNSANANAAAGYIVPADAQLSIEEAQNANIPPN